MNPSAHDFYLKNIFSVTRQLHHSARQTMDALDVCIFLNGFPIITVELKNRYTGQSYKNAIKQYQEDRPATDPLFAPRRCAVHFAVDDDEMCSELKGKDSWFLPFNKGVNGGAGNPWKESKILTEYLWQEILQKDSLADILENYAQVIEKEEEGKPKPVKRVIWPRYHQLDCVPARATPSLGWRTSSSRWWRMTRISWIPSSWLRTASIWTNRFVTTSLPSNASPIL